LCLRRDKYKLLERFEVVVPDEQLSSLEMLEPAWAEFCTGLDAAGVRLERSKDAFRERVKGMLDGRSSQALIAVCAHAMLTRQDLVQAGQWGLMGINVDLCACCFGAASTKT